MRWNSFFSWKSVFLTGIFVAVLAAVPLVSVARAQSKAQSPLVSERSKTEMLGLLEANIPEPVFAFDKNVTLDAVYPNMVFAAGGEVELTGEVHGDLIVAGGTVRVMGPVDQDIYAAGGTVVIESTVGGNVVVAGGEVRFTDTAEVAGSVIGAAESFTQAGLQTGSGWLAAQQIVVSGAVLGDLQVTAERMRIADDGFVSGVVRGQTQEALVIDPNASVDVDATERTPEEPAKVAKSTVGAAMVLVGKMFWNVTTWSVLLLILLFLLRDRFTGMAQRVLAPETVGKALLAGSVLLVITPVAMVLLALSVVGLRAAGMLFLVWMTLLWLGPVLPMLGVGQKLLPKHSSWIQAVAGAGVLGVLFALPLVGWVVKFGVALLGAGAVIQILMGPGQKKK